MVFDIAQQEARHHPLPASLRKGLRLAPCVHCLTLRVHMALGSGVEDQVGWPGRPVYTLATKVLAVPLDRLPVLCARRAFLPLSVDLALAGWLSLRIMDACEA
jgi:hypothetical protein